MRNRAQLFFVGLVLLVLAACSQKPLCPAYSDADPAQTEASADKS